MPGGLGADSVQGMSPGSLLFTPLRPVGRFVASMLDRVVCVAGAAGLSQGPEFMQQYLQRLGGHLDEARRHLRQFVDTAKSAGISLDQLVERTGGAHADPALAGLGQVIVDTRERVEVLTVAEQALRDASLWERPFVFVRYLDWQIAEGTWGVYKPAVPTTVEGLVYAGVGLLLALGLYLGISGAIGKGVGRWRRRRELAKAEAEAASLDHEPEPSSDRERREPLKNADSR
ncbi:MAG: DUF2937 family protein [Opitutaceae bacterium]|nr:DUF2937 family protein [Opitutaceae bacterium]